MARTLYTNIGLLVTNSPSTAHSAGGESGPTGEIRDAALIVDNGVIAWVGTAADAEISGGFDIDEVVNLHGHVLIPGFVDSHSHLIFAGDRSQEFAARMAGTSYAAGGIRSTVAATREATDDELRENVQRLLNEMHTQGTTTVEIKSGYGLSVEDEERLTRIAKEFTDEVTFLGAHVVPSDYADKRDEYIQLVTGPMLEACAPHSKWIDVFCETGAFTPEETRTILTAGIEAGLKPKLHASQLSEGEGIALAVDMGATSVDHCTYLSDADIALLASSDTVATLLPGVEFSTKHPYPDARKLIDAGVTVAISTDCNPGSSYTTSMPLCIALAVREMGMTPSEALWAATAGGAAALDRSDVGVIAKGTRADFAEITAEHYIHLAYRPGVPLIGRVWKDGELIAG